MGLSYRLGQFDGRRLCFPFRTFSMSCVYMLDHASNITRGKTSDCALGNCVLATDLRVLSTTHSALAANLDQSACRIFVARFLYTSALSYDQDSRDIKVFFPWARVALT